VGLARPVVLSGLSPSDQRMLSVLEGGRLVPSRLSDGARAGLDRLRAAGHTSPEHVPPVRALTVAIHGADAVGMAVARSLARQGHVIEFIDDAPAVAESAGVFASARAGETCAGAAARDVRTAVPGASVRVGMSIPDAAIVTGVGATDPAAWVPLLRGDVPHVLVAADEAGIDVGPLVLPGTTACARCVDVAKTQSDSAWPRLRLQCGASRRIVVEPHVADLAGALMAGMLIPLAEGATPAWAVNCVWRIEPGRAPAARPASPHPDCGCGAAGAAATSARISAP
jgi:hypothetical protein